MPNARLPKSRYLSGLQCARRLWLDAYQPWEATPSSDTQRHIYRMNEEIVDIARTMYPGGVVVSTTDVDHPAAFDQTRLLLADESVPAIFNAAFEFEGTQIRVDILERLEGETPRFGIREIKSSTCVREAQYLADLAIQKWVLEQCDLTIDSAEILHLNADYVRMGQAAERSKIFIRADLIPRLGPERMQAVGARVDEMRETLSESSEPGREPGDFCKRPRLCEFWDSCTAKKSGKWFIEQGSAKEYRKSIMAKAAESQEVWTSGSLAEDLKVLRPPIWILGVGAIGPSVPLFEGTRPYEPIAYQWSLHRIDEEGKVEFFEFLAGGRVDPREEIARSLIATLEQDSAPVAVYSGYEKRRLKEMAALFPDLENALLRIADRLVDLLPIVCEGVYHPDFLGSYSIQTVAPALAPSLGDLGLAQIADGSSALKAFARIVKGDFDSNEIHSLRASLLEYYQRETEALLGVIRGLRELTG